MSLARGIPRRAVGLPNAEGDEPVSISVRGLSGLDIAAILREDGGAALAGLYVQLTTGETTAESVASVGLDMLAELPDLVAHIIARAADEPENWELVRGMPVGLQMDLLDAIGELTFASETARKKVLEAVLRFVTKPSQSDLLQQSTTGSGPSGSR